MTTRSTGAVSDTVTNVSPARSPGLMALNAARRWSRGKITTKGLLDEKTERQVWRPSFPSKKSCIDGSIHKGIREQRRVLTRNHHVDVREFVMQDLQGFGHP